MGVAGCGKSTLAGAIASQADLPLIEGDEFHSAAGIAKMRAGILSVLTLRATDDITVLCSQVLEWLVRIVGAPL
jgi:gluconate kinase